MKETELRIQKYKALLPRARERVIAALMIFAVSLAMLTVSTLSWITLAVAPEVSGVNTTIAANGNLEIALAGRYDSEGNLLEPAPTAIGDGALSVTERNLTWGNLVNLSDPSYALERIVLRPASLNKSTLLTAPLYAAKYSAYGQVVDYNDDFALTKWNGVSGFIKSETKGINAISSVKFETIDDYVDPNEEKYKELAANATNYLRNADREWEAMNSKMDPIGGLIETFMSGQLKENSSNPNALENEVCDPDDILAFYDLMVYMYDVPMESLGNALIEILYMYQFNASTLINESGTSVYPNPVKFTSVDAFCEGALAELSKISAARANATGKGDDFVENITTALFNNSNFKNVIFKTVQQYITHRATLSGIIADFENENGIKSKAEKAKMGEGSVVWNDISANVQKLVNISTCEIGGWTVDKLAGTGDGMKAAIGMLSGTQEAVIKDGLLVDIESMLHDGDGIRVTNLEVRISKSALKAKLEAAGYGSISGAVDIVNIGKDYVSVKANVTTYATAKYPTATGYLDITKANDVVGVVLKLSNYYAQDTYGLSVDFWLRSNAPNTYLILEGEVIYDNNPITAVVNITNANGESTSETVEVYLATVKRTVETKINGESAEEPSVHYFTDQEIYQRDNVWYYVSNSQPVVITDSVEEYTDEATGAQTVITTNAVIEGSPEQKLSKNVIGYSGANRIWKDETYLGDSYNMDHSTTQGTGSCYTFYVNDPSDTDKYLDLLSALRVVFYDAEGNYLASAVLNKKLAYSDHGKVTVPLVILEENSTVYANVPVNDGTNSTERVPTIANLTKGDAKLITALVYLDGELVDNTKVLDSSEIQGKLNIQFGSTYVPNEALKDDALRDEEVRVSGEVVGDKQADFNPANPHTVKVKINIDGNTPNIVTGNFVRALNNVQGTLYSSVVFTKTEENGVWEAIVEFDAPGSFIMRSVFIDGIEYDIERVNGEDSIAIEINGFAVTSFASVEGLGSNAYHITADSSVEEMFVLKLASDAYRPTTVKGVFVNEKNVYVTVTFESNISDITEWTGKANFIYSGTYKMTNVVIDGSYYPLPGNVTYERYISTGLRANVDIRIVDDYVTDENLTLTNGSIAYLYRGFSHEFSVAASIVDGSGKALGYVGDKIEVNYTNNLTANLYWNGEEYVGEFLVENPGEFKFSNIYLNTYAQSIRSAADADSVTCIPTDPVEYLGIVNTIPEEVITVGNTDNGNIITMRFKNAQASNLYGLFEVRQSVNGAPSYVVLAASRSTYGAESDNTNDFTFNITQDGYWKLIDTKLSLVYDGSTTPGTFYLGDGMLSIENNAVVLKTTSDDGVVDVVNTPGAEGYDSQTVFAAFNAADGYYTFDENAGTTHTNALREDGTKVISEIYVTYGGNYDSTKSGNAFLVPYTNAISGLTVTFEDFEHKAINGVDIENVHLTVAYRGGSKDNGGYESTELKTYTGFVVGFSSTDGKTYTSENHDLLYAGNYIVEFSYTIDGVTTKNPSACPWSTNVSVHSVTPSVVVTGVSNKDTEIDTQITWQEKSSIIGRKSLSYTFSNPNTNTITDGVNVTVYAQATKSGTGDATFNRPTLKFKASGIDSFSTVKFTIPAGSAKAIDVTLNGTTESSDYTLGSTFQVVSKGGSFSWAYITYSVSGYKGHGEDVRIETVTITKGGIAYTVTLDNPIIINNPSSIDQKS